MEIILISDFGCGVSDDAGMDDAGRPSVPLWRLASKSVRRPTRGVYGGLRFRGDPVTWTYLGYTRCCRQVIRYRKIKVDQRRAIRE